jgi:hypothetical protein
MLILLLVSKDDSVPKHETCTFVVSIFRQRGERVSPTWLLVLGLKMHLGQEVI